MGSKFEVRSSVFPPEMRFLIVKSLCSYFFLLDATRNPKTRNATDKVIVYICHLWGATRNFEKMKVCLVERTFPSLLIFVVVHILKLRVASNVEVDI